MSPLFTHHANRKTIGSVVVPAGALAMLITQPIALGGNTWTGGGGSTNWSENNNWGGGAPGYGTLTFTTGGTQGTTSVNNSITAQNQLLWTGSSAWTLNNSGGTLLSLYDNGGVQAKIENQSSGLVTINAPITFAATAGAAYGEINAVSGGITFGSGTLTVNGSAVNGIKLFGSGQATTFNNTVSSTGKWFGLTGANTTMAVGGAFTSGDIYAMNGGTVKLNSGGTITTPALRLGGDFGNTGNQNQTQGGTLQFTSLTGGQSFGSIINTVSGNTSGALLVDSLNTSGTNTISGNIFLDSALRINQASGGTISITNATLDLKAQALTLTGTGGNIGITGVIGNSTGSGQLVVGVNGSAGGPTATLSSANTYSGDTFVRAGTLAFTSTGSSANSTIRLGSTTGSGVDAGINLTTATGGTTISSLLNPVATSGSGTLSLNSQNTSGTNAYTGLLALDRDLTITQAAGGTLNLSEVNTKDIKGNKLTVNTGGTVNISSTLSSSLGAGGYLLKQGAGTLILGNTSNNYTGSSNLTLNANGTQIQAGTLAIAADTSLGLAPAGAYHNVQFTGSGTLRSDSTISLNANRNLSIAGGATAGFDSNGNTFTINGAISGATGNVEKTGAGTVVLTGNNTYAATTITTGTLQIGNGSTTGNLGSGAVTNNAALSFNRTNTLTQGSDFGTISGTGTLTQAGSGTLVLGAANTYTGATTVAAGKFAVNGSTSAASAVGVSSGGTLGGSGNVGGNTTIASGGTLAPGNSPGVLTIAGTTTLSSGSIFEWELDTAQSNPTTNRGTAYDGVNTTSLSGSGAIFKIMLTGTQDFADTFWNQTRTWTDIFKSADGSATLSDWAPVFSGGFQYSYNGQNVQSTTQGSFTMTGSSLTWSAVPEPSNAIIGLIAATALLRRRREN